MSHSALMTAHKERRNIHCCQV